MATPSHLDIARDSEKAADYAQAIHHYMLAWQQKPQDIQLFRSLENLLLKMRAIDQLKSAYQLAVELFPEDVQVASNYANLLNHLGEHEDALAQCDRLLTGALENVPLLVNRANAFRFVGEVDAAIQDYEKALRLEPTKFPQASFNLGCLYLLKEDFQKGYPLYEARFKMAGYERLQSRNQAPKWEEQSLKGKSILVYAEQGLGDTIMFSRYLKQLMLEADSVYLECQKPIVWMFQQWPDLKMIPRSTLDKPCPVETDYQIPILSLAGIFKDKDVMIPSEYWQSIQTQKSPRVSKLMEILTDSKVGFAWQGNSKAAVDLGRSMDFTLLKPFEEVEGIERISLQAKDGLPPDFDNTKWLIWKDLDDSGNAFEETIQILHNLDLVICTDSAIAHLAGSLCKEVWLLLQYTAEWRWGLTATETQWYPTMTLYRQPEKGDWESVIEQVLKDVRARIELSG